MGIDATAATYLLRLKRAGLDFSDVLTLGRQSMGHLGVRNLGEIARRSGIPVDDATITKIASEQWANELFKFVGASTVQSIDASAYEGADHICDMNNPIDPSLEQKYDVVYDGGTLEHIFNIPTALMNCMKMVKVGGHFISISVCNNFVGHGFYQFSPEFFFRALSASRGFAVKDAIFVELGHDPIAHPRWYRAPDPDVVHRRVTFTGDKRMYLVICAQKISHQISTETSPQQSDFENILWQQKNLAQVSESSTLKSIYKSARKRAISQLPDAILSRIRDARIRRSERNLLRRLDPYSD